MAMTFERFYLLSASWLVARSVGVPPWLVGMTDAEVAELWCALVPMAIWLTVSLGLMGWS